jgi:periplasmic divalent cation tolerance protein
VPRIHSVYRWQGKVESGEEALAIFKLGASRYAEFESKLRSLHPYDVPEIISCKIEAGLPEYLRWVTENCG